MVKIMKTLNKNITAEKETGRIYTPSFIVDNILTLSGYYGKIILKKHVIDNSCGNGAFLCKIVKQYCEEFVKSNLSTQGLKEELETFIHGIEIEAAEHKKCLENMSLVAKKFGINDIKWDVICADAMSVEKYNGKMAFVLGNPPYVRVHNMGKAFCSAKQFLFSQGGMTDLFIVFYELGIKMLSKNGTLGYITPSSYFNSVAGAYMRGYLVQNNLLKTVVDLQHFQAFPSTTYTAITILRKDCEGNDLNYYKFDQKNLIPYYVDTLSPTDYLIDGKFYFASKEELKVLAKVHSNSDKSDISVKNGYATLCDPVFIHDFDFQSQYIIPVVKASKGITKKILFPYYKNSVLVDENELKKDSHVYNYLLANKEKLVRRSNEKDSHKYWYAFGRSQAIGDTFREKLAISSLLRNEYDFKFTKAPSGTGVYGGLYITSETISLEEISKVLKTKEFMSYVSLLGKYKSGGYYTFSSKDVKKFLDYKFAFRGGSLC